LEKIKSLPPADLREVCQAVLQWTAQVTATSLRDNGSAPLNGQEEDANEASFFAALDELRQCVELFVQIPRVLSNNPCDFSTQTSSVNWQSVCPTPAFRGGFARRQDARARLVSAL
jgi:hypothetical protein